MSEPFEEQARRIVEAFKTDLEPEVRDRIGEAQYRDLTLMISRVIAAELGDSARLVEDAAQRIRGHARQWEAGH